MHNVRQREDGKKKKEGGSGFVLQLTEQLRFLLFRERKLEKK